MKAHTFQGKELKLNLGCGNKKLDGYINIDCSNHCEPDLLLDLENTPYPFPDNSVKEIIMKSVLEHFPLSPKKFFRIIKDIYRICQDGALLHIECPHPSHRWQVADFTHQKPIHPEGIMLLSKKYCQNEINLKGTRTPLALIYDINFTMTKYECEMDPKCIKHIENIFGHYDPKKADSYAYLLKDVASKQKFTLKALKI